MSKEFESKCNDEHFVHELPQLVSSEKVVNCEKEKQLNKNLSVRHRRPDMKLYVPPKAKGSNNTLSETDVSSADSKTCVQTLSELEITDSSHHKHKNSAIFGSETFDDQKSSIIDMTQDMRLSPKAGDVTAPQEVDEQNSDIKASNTETIADESSWDSLFDENGDCVRPEFLEKVNSALSLKNSDLKLEKTRIDYMNFQYNEPEIDNSEFAHVLEVYDFPIELKTQDIMASLSVFNCRDFDIKWVDDTHALVVFSTPNAASEALKAIYPNIKLRPLSQGIRESKIKARKCSEFLRPYKQRPETSASLARRLVTGALGLKVRLSPEQRAAERQKLQEAKERKRQAIKQGHDVWEGNVS